MTELQKEPPFTIAISLQAGNVVLNFNRPVNRLILEPDHAAALSRGLTMAIIDLAKAGKDPKGANDVDKSEPASG